MSQNPSRLRKLSRRDFLKGTGLGAGVLILGWTVAPRFSVAGLFSAEASSEPAFAPSAYFSLATDGTVTIITHRSEMGQGIRTGLAAIIADELEADWSRIRVVQADGDEERYGDQNTDGSRSVRQFFRPLREAGAAARQMLVAAAAARWGVDAAQCEARHHQIYHAPSGRSLGYGELATEASAQPVPAPEAIRLKDRKDFRYIGKPLPIVDLDDMVTGRAVYGADVRLPGMLVATLERCPVVGGTLEGFDGDAARAVTGVVKILALDSHGGLGGGFQPLCGVAVLAKNTWAALKGRAALEVDWEAGENTGYDSPDYRDQLEKTAAEPGKRVREIGDVDKAFGAAEKTVEASYYVPHLAQAPMETPCAVAHFKDGRCEVWGPLQNPLATRGEVAKALGVEASEVTVHVTLLGGGFGRKSKPDFAVEAALLSKATGTPVQVLWTREDDIRHGYFHTVSSQYLKAALDGGGWPTAWLQRSVFPTIGATFNREARSPSTGELGLGLLDLPFAIPNLCLESGETKAHLRIGWMRSVANIYHGFAAGSFADELAAAAGRDPKDYLLELIGEPRKIDFAAEGTEYSNYGEPAERYPYDTGRLRRVVEMAAEGAGWGRTLPKSRALGIAAHRSFLTYVAIVAQVEVNESGKLAVREVHCAVDCGTYINSDRVRAQMEGAVVYGLSLAYHGDITARGGAVEQSNFHDYPVLRIHETPRLIETYLVDNGDLPAGVGEPGVPPLAPAVTNAYYAATGHRVRELPLSKLGIV